MELPKYIQTVGMGTLADRLRVSRQSVHQWLHLKHPPKLPVAYKLILISDGLLSFDDIYIPFLRRKLAGKKFRVENARGKSVQLEFKF